MVLDVQWVCLTGFPWLLLMYLTLYCDGVICTVKVEVRIIYLCEINVSIDNFIIIAMLVSVSSTHSKCIHSKVETNHLCLAWICLLFYACKTMF